MDRLIDGALASYSSVEPLAGLEGRVGSRVRVAGRQRMFGWGLAVAVAASVVVVGIMMRTEQRPALKGASGELVGGLGPVAVPKERPVVPPRAWRNALRQPTRPKVLPKLEQFPAPSPMTAEEHALVTFVERDPKAAVQMFADLRKRADETIEIQPIQIPPLQSDGAE